MQYYATFQVQQAIKINYWYSALLADSNYDKQHKS